MPCLFSAGIESKAPTLYHCATATKLQHFPINLVRSSTLLPAGLSRSAIPYVLAFVDRIPSLTYTHRHCTCFCLPCLQELYSILCIRSANMPLQVIHHKTPFSRLWHKLAFQASFKAGEEVEIDFVLRLGWNFPFQISDGCHIANNGGSSQPPFSRHGYLDRLLQP